jgi:hypothetical protein
MTNTTMRTFEDEGGRCWVATVAERSGPDYKGRFHLQMKPESSEETVALTDVRWNSSRSARRTLETMSVVELRRRLRQARGRARSAMPVE